MSLGKLEEAKKVTTYSQDKVENGFLIELYKNDEKTILYLTTAKPGAFKGYHLHRIRSARYVCLRGKMKIILYKPGTKVREEYILDSDRPQRLFIPNEVATGLENVGDDEAWLINFPDPSYDPSLTDEQVEYTQEELERGIVK